MSKELVFTHKAPFVLVECDGLPISGYSPLDTISPKQQFPIFYGNPVNRAFVGYEVTSFFDGRIFYAQDESDARKLAEHIARAWVCAE